MGRAFDSDMALKAMRIRQENLVARHKAISDEKALIKRMKLSQYAKNLDHEYAALLEAHRRLPLAFQRGAMERLRVIAEERKKLQSNYKNLPSFEAGDYQRMLGIA